MKPALLIIDMINNFQFTHGKILAKKALNITQAIKNLKNFCYEKNYPIIYVNDHYNLWQANSEKIIRYCQNHVSEPIISEIIPNETDFFLIKPKHSAFYGTALNTLLHHLNVNTLIITGIAGNICVLFTANDAYMREFNLLIPNDCIASTADEDNEYALKMMKNVLKAEITPSCHLNSIMNC